MSLREPGEVRIKLIGTRDWRHLFQIYEQRRYLTNASGESFPDAAQDNSWLELGYEIIGSFYADDVPYLLGVRGGSPSRLHDMQTTRLP